MNSAFKDDVLWCFKKILPIMANPGNEQEIYDKVKKIFLDIGFIDAGIELIDEEYVINPGIGFEDDAVYRRKTPNLGLSYYGKKDATYVFNAHLDHFFARKITEKYIEKDGLIVAGENCILGADCKMGIAIAYASAKKLIALDYNVELVFDACEEAGLIGLLEFVNHKQHEKMNFVKRYKAGKDVFCYCFDGLWEKEWSDKPGYYITRKDSLFLNSYLMTPEKEKVLVTEKDRIKWRKIRKKERAFLKNLKNIDSEIDISRIRVMAYGAGFILMNKMIPSIMLPVGFFNCHTVNEYYDLSCLNQLEEMLF